MRNVGQVVAGLAVGCLVAACSTPASVETRHPDASIASQQARDLHLATDPVGGMATVSDLESGRLPKPQQPRPDRLLTKKAAPAPDGETKVEAAAPGPVTVADEASSSAAPTPAPAAAASPPAEEVVEIRGKGTTMSMPTDGYYPATGGGFGGYGPRDPAVIIRGGRGGPFDDCDRDRPGMHGHHGVLINRLTPVPIGIR